MAQLQQYKNGETYYGYNPMSGQGIAFADQNEFNKHFSSFDPNAKALPVDPNIFNQTPNQLVSGERDYQGLAQLAGSSGMSLGDMQNVLAQQQAGSLPDLQKQYGIGDMEGRVFAPAPSTQQLFTDAYAAAGLTKYREQLEQLMAEQSKVKEQLNERLSKVDENPWLSEASRLASVGNTKRFFDGTLSNLTDQQMAMAQMYQQGLSQVNDLVGRTTTDMANQRSIDQAQLNYMLQKAEQDMAMRQQMESSKLARYLPEYLQSMPSSAPEVVGSASTGYYAWDSNTGQFKQVIRPAPTGGSGGGGLPLNKAPNDAQIRNFLLENKRANPDMSYYELWGELSDHMQSQGLNPANYDSLFWEVLHPEGSEGYRVNVLEPRKKKDDIFDSI